MPTPCVASGQYRRWWNGTPTFRASSACVPKRRTRATSWRTSMELFNRPSPTLRETQQTMASLILHPEELEVETPEWAAVPPRGDRRERLEVYIDGYLARVQEAIEESYPAVTHVIGHHATHALVSRYVSAF